MQVRYRDSRRSVQALSRFVRVTLGNAYNLPGVNPQGLSRGRAMFGVGVTSGPDFRNRWSAVRRSKDPLAASNFGCSAALANGQSVPKRICDMGTVPEGPQGEGIQGKMLITSREFFQRNLYADAKSRASCDQKRLN